MPEENGSVKASLADRAIQAWKNAEVERKGRRINQTVKFRGEARKEFGRIFPNEETTSANAIGPSSAKIVCGSVTFIAQKKEGGIFFFVEVKCQYCDKHFLPEYANSVSDLATIGSRLSAPQTCEKCLKERREVKESQSTAELVLEKVREIYYLIKEE